MRTLYDLSDLKESRFGRPPPRHGLILLWWFAHECVLIDSNDCMIAQCDPENGAFGFHRFYNRERLLPYSNLPYYEVGNLHTTGSLPQYVTQYYTGYIDNSNTDRVIVLFNSRWNRFDSVYVTQHSDLVKFDQNHTYCISIKLMKDIKDLSREGFLREPILPKRPTPPEHCSIDMTNIVMSNAQAKQPTPPEQCSIDMTNNVMPNAQAKRPNPPEYLAIDIINGGHSQARPVITVTCTSQPVQSKTCLSKKCYYVLICVLILLLFIIAAIVFLLYKMK